MRLEQSLTGSRVVLNLTWICYVVGNAKLVLALEPRKHRQPGCIIPTTSYPDLTWAVRLVMLSVKSRIYIGKLIMKWASAMRNDFMSAGTMRCLRSNLIATITKCTNFGI